MWSRADIRRRWRSLLLLGLLAGVTAAFATASFAGARRTDTALSRLEKATNAANAFIFTSQVGDMHPDWKHLASRPEVAQLAVWDLIFCYLDGQPNGVLFASDGDGWLTKVDKPVVLSGRVFNPKADDEAVVNEQVASVAHIGVGAVMQVRTYAPDQLSASGTPHGPNIALRDFWKLSAIILKLDAELQESKDVKVFDRTVNAIVDIDSLSYTALLRSIRALGVSTRAEVQEAAEILAMLAAVYMDAFMTAVRFQEAKTGGTTTAGWGPRAW